MSWTLRGKPSVCKATKQLAKEFAEMEPAPHDRPLSERRLQVYQRILEQGFFRPVQWAKAHCKETGGIYRVNGKHTSVMLSGLEKLPEFYVIIEEYNCETLEDVAKLYSTFDSKTQSRTVGDINASFAGTVPELREMNSKVINLSVAGMSYFVWGSDSRMNDVPAAEKAELLLEHSDFVVWLDVLWKGGIYDEQGKNHSRAIHLQRQGVVAAQFGSWQKDKEDATDFWQAVRDETGTEPTLPDRKLARYLHTIRGMGSGAGKKSITRESYVKCIHAWNAWRDDKTTNLRYVADAKVPEIS